MLRGVELTSALFVGTCTRRSARHLSFVWLHAIGFNEEPRALVVDLE